MSNYVYYIDGKEYTTNDAISLYDNYVYYVDGKRFTTNNYDEIPWDDISSPDENTPAFIDTMLCRNVWYLKGKVYHRLTGKIFDGHDEYFYLNDKYYENVHDWLKEHPNPDLYFHKIGIFTETDKVLWYLKN
jgi:hypothetical protein